jgi:chemotaxis response regulator CheB
MVVLCVARHLYLAQHLARVLAQAGAATRSAVGLDEARLVAADCSPDVVAADYDVLATLSLSDWEQDDILSRRPVIAVSLTRRPGESNALDVNGIAAPLYLPEVGAAGLLRVLQAAAERTTVCAPHGALPWPGRVHHAAELK